MRPVQESFALPVRPMTPQAIEREAMNPSRPGAASFSATLNSIAPQVAAPPATAPSETPRPVVQVRSGDTLTSLIRQHLDRAGLPQQGRDLPALARQVASANGIKDPDRIFIGARIDLSSVSEGRTSGRTTDALADRITDRTADRNTHRSADRSADRNADRGADPLARPGPTKAAHTLLDRTLARAVDKGFLDPANQAQARARVLELAQSYGFQPDDFARVVLLESDGFNPKASNGRCHGIIQFCEGPASGAASVGLSGQARTILDKDVLTQLDLVDRYFQDTGLESFGTKSGRRIDLADLYLTILTPTARSERDVRAPLSIAGTQAAVLHEAGDRTRPITRQSIAQGLHRYSQQLFADGSRKPMPTIAEGGKPVASARQSLAAGLAYQTVSMMPNDAETRSRSGP